MSYTPPLYDNIILELEPDYVPPSYDNIILELHDGELPAGGYFPINGGPIHSPMHRGVN